MRETERLTKQTKLLTNQTNKKMNARKFNSAQRASNYSGRTFDEIIKTLSKYTDLSKLTGKQIGELVNAMYASKEIGSNEMYDEMKNNK